MIIFLFRTFGCISLFSTASLALFVFDKPLMPDCDKYRTGKFYIYNKQSKQKVDIERRDSLHIETNADGDITVMKVNWTGPCQYELFFNYMTPKEISKTASKQRIFEAEGAIILLRIKILSGTDDYYVFEASKEGFRNLRDTVWLVKEYPRAFNP